MSQPPIDTTKESLCPVTGVFCTDLAKHISLVADYYARLVKENSGDIFTNGSEPAVCLGCRVYKEGTSR